MLDQISSSIVKPNLGFSVIIPTAGRPKLLKEALESVGSQSHTPEEVIVVHNGPMVGYNDFQKADNLTFVSEPQFLYPGAAANIGANISKSQFLAFLEDDDYWAEDYLFQIAKEIQRKESPLYVGGVQFVDQDKKMGRFQLILPGEAQRAVYYRNPGINGSNVVINRAFFIGMNGFSESLRSGQDRDFLARTIEKGNFAHPVPGAVAFKRNHDLPQVSNRILQSNRVFFRAHWSKMRPLEKLVAVLVGIKRHLFFFLYNHRAPGNPWISQKNYVPTQSAMGILEGQHIAPD